MFFATSKISEIREQILCSQSPRHICSLGTGEVIHVMSFKAKEGQVEEFESKFVFISVQQLNVLTCHSHP